MNNWVFENWTTMVGVDKTMDEGFSLIEVMAAMLILSLLFISVNTSFVLPIKWGAHSRQETIACNLGNIVLEKFRFDTTKLDESNEGQTLSVMFPEIDTVGLEMDGEIVQMESWPDYPLLYTVVVRVFEVEGIDSKCWEFGTVIRKR